MCDDDVWRTGVSDVKVVSQDGSPHSPKTFVLWNPPLLKPGRGGGGSGGNLLAGMPLMSRTEARARLKFNKWGWVILDSCPQHGRAWFSNVWVSDASMAKLHFSHERVST